MHCEWPYIIYYKFSFKSMDTQHACSNYYTKTVDEIE